MGASEFSAPALKMLICEGYELVGVVTQPDRPKGRGNKTAAPVVKDIAMDAGVRVFQPEKPSDIYDEIVELSVDLCVTAAYGAILKKKFLRIPRFGTINVHASLLPQYRGASPIHRALLNGDAETGITTMLTDAGVDTGPVLLSEKIAIPEGAYFQELHDMLAELGADVLKRTIPAYLSGVLAPVPQDGERASYAPVIQKGDGELDFSLTSRQLVNMVRAFSVWPGAAATLNGRRVKIHRAEDGGPARILHDAEVVDCDPQNAQHGGPRPQDARCGGPIPHDAVQYGSVIGINRDALSILCGGDSLFNVTRLQFENGRAMDISECWHNLRF